MKTKAQRAWIKKHKRPRTPEYRRAKYKARGYSEAEIRVIMGKLAGKAGLRRSGGRCGGFRGV